MSTVIAKNIQIGTSGTATNNFTWYQPASPDGTVRLGVGNSGTTTDVLTMTGAGLLTATSLAGSGSAITALNASNLGSGTVPDARFPATLPAVSGANLTSLNASNISTGTIPTGILAVTQAAKTANTTIATTAFVDQLRSLLTQSTASGGGTLVIGDRGTLVSVTAGVTIPANVFAANDVVTIYNNSAGNITITQGGSLTLRQVGTANTGNRTLAQRGLVTVVFISATEAVISGGGLT
jgi:hypothetical protein